MFPDGTYGILTDLNNIPGGQILARMANAAEAERFVQRMSINPNAPNLSTGVPFPNAMANGMHTQGGAKPFRWGETAQSLMRAGGLDRANDLDRNKWANLWENKEALGERAGEGLKRLSKIMTSSRTLFQEYEKRALVLCSRSCGSPRRIQ